jgi:regulator of CtrA degradation
VASWLLVQRAVREGDMLAAEACQERYRLSEATSAEVNADPDLPASLLELLERSSRLYERVLHLDRRMYLEPTQSEVPHPVLSQMERLQQAFGR